MVAIKALIALLPFYLAMTAAMPHYPTTSNTTSTSVDMDMAMASTASTADKASDWNVSTTDGSVTVNFYEDKNPDHSTPIDPSTCEGKSQIALMKWRSNCKGLAATWRRKECWNRAPSEARCCPVPRVVSCTKYAPEQGE